MTMCWSWAGIPTRCLQDRVSSALHLFSFILACPLSYTALTLLIDDGSGTIGILAVAKALTKFRVKNAVRFAFWSAEEFGLLGSYAYIKSLNNSATEVAKIRAYLNFDMVCTHTSTRPSPSRAPTPSRRQPA